LTPSAVDVSGNSSLATCCTGARRAWRNGAAALAAQARSFGSDRLAHRDTASPDIRVETCRSRRLRTSVALSFEWAYQFVAPYLSDVSHLFFALHSRLTRFVR
jgi:hypothetical protein